MPSKQKHRMPTQMNPSISSSQPTNMNDAKSEIKLVSDRVVQTKNDIEKLKAELQKLIQKGVGAADHSETEQNAVTSNVEVKTSNVDKICVNSSRVTGKPLGNVIDNEISENKINDVINANVNKLHKAKILNKEKSPVKQQSEDVKKVKHYDQQEAREYIKKQRGRRKELMKNKRNEVAITADIKKQRLEELHKKSLQLVSKSVRNKRERSRSSEKQSETDRKVNATQFHDKTTKSQSYEAVNEPNRKQTKVVQLDDVESNVIFNVPNKKNNTAPDLILKSIPNNEKSLQSSETVNQTIQNIVDITDNSKNKNKEISAHGTVSERKKWAKVAQCDYEKPATISKISDRMKSVINVGPHLRVEDTKPSISHGKQPNNSSHKKSFNVTHPQLKNITLRSPSLEDLGAIPKLHITSLNINTPNHFEKQRKAAVKIQAAFRGYRQRKLFKLTFINKHLSTKQTITTEVQNIRSEVHVPEWLQTPTTIPYPYNFINAVRRKLYLTVQQPTPRTTDAAVQSSPLTLQFEEHLTEDNSKKSNSSEVQGSNLKNSNLKSFLSHKCLELEVRPATESNGIHLKSKISLKNGIASDSDTSKNIPEISSESNVPRSSDTSYDELNPKINTEKVKNLKLRQPKSISTITDLQHFDVYKDRDATWADNKSKYGNNSNRSSLQSNTSDVRTSTVISEISSKAKHFSGKDSSTASSKRSKDSNILTSSVISEIHSKKKYPGQDDDVTACSRTSKSSEILTSPAVFQKHSSARDSIIASNKCNYSISSATKKITNETSSSNSKKPLLLPDYNNKSVSDSILTSVNQISNENVLSSFHAYMRGLKNEKSSVDYNSDQKSSHKSDVSWKRSVENKENLEKLHCTIESGPNSNDAKIEADFKLENSQSSVKSNNVMKRYQEYSSNFDSIASSVPSLKHPSVSLKASFQATTSEDTDTSLTHRVTNIALKPGKKCTLKHKTKSHEIRLKFEAELHLLNEFNNSLRQIMEVEKSLVELHNNKSAQNQATVTYHTQDTQTSFVSKTTTNSKTEINTEDVSHIENNSHKIQIPTINYSRGSDVTGDIDTLSLESSIVEIEDQSLVTTGLELSQIKENSHTSSIEDSNVEVPVKERRYNGNVYAGLSLDMFEQLIKDEDVRIENLKTILKIREKALVDRTKGELAWLEIQKRHLKDSGQLQELSTIKKKQRGLLVKLEHERHEIQRLKQKQKAASKERKSALREQHNMIKAQLSTNNMITKIKRKTKEERRQSGPVKVYNIKSHSESIRSETSMSRKSSATEEVISVVSHSHSIISQITEEILSGENPDAKNTGKMTVPVTETVKRSLLMREVALQKRRKAAEELLQWHQRLVKEEEKIAELELAANAIINQHMTSMDSEDTLVEKHEFKGSQLNLLWHNMTGREEKKFNDQVTYTMSKVAFERFCKDALGKSKGFHKKCAKHSANEDYISNKHKAELTQVEIVKSELPIGSSDEKARTYSKLNRTSSSLQSKIPSNNSNQVKPSKCIVETAVSKNDSHINEYSSDFESITKASATESITSKNESSKLLVNDENQTDVGEVSFNEQSVIDESQLNSDLNNDISISENEDEVSAVTEISRINKDISNASTSTEIINDTSSSSHISPSEIIKTAGSLTQQTPITNKLSLTDHRETVITSEMSTQLSVNGYFTNSNKSSRTINEVSANGTPIAKSVRNIVHPNHVNGDITNSRNSNKILSEVKSNLASTVETSSKSDSLSSTGNAKQKEHIPTEIADEFNHSSVISESSPSVSSRQEISNLEGTTSGSTSLQDMDNNISNKPLKSANTSSCDMDSVSKMHERKESIKDAMFYVETKTDSVSTCLNDIQINIEEVNDNDISNNIQSSVQSNESSITATISDNNSSTSFNIKSSGTNKQESDDAEGIVDPGQSEINSDLSDTQSNQEFKSESDINITESSSSNQLNSTAINERFHEDILINTNSKVFNHTSHKINKGQDNDERELSSQDTTINEELSFDIPANNKERKKDEENGRKAEADAKETIENKSNINTLSEGDLNQQHTNTSNKTETTSSKCVVDETLSQTGEINSESSVTSTDRSRSTETPLSLSYGFIEKRKPFGNESKSEEGSLEKEITEETSSRISSAQSRKSENSKKNIIETSKDDLKQTSEEQNLKQKSVDCIEEMPSDNNRHHHKENIKNEETENSNTTTNNVPLIEDQQAKQSEVDHIDVKKRVMEILADVNVPSPRGDKSPRLQDFYVTAYDIVSPESSPELGSPNENDDQNFTPPQGIYGSDEVEELLKKQLEIEQEIKEIQQQQQKEQLPYLYLREIPNKPPPPYTPPVTSSQIAVSGSVLPCNVSRISTITNAVVDILYKAYLNNSIQNVTISDKAKTLLSKNNIEHGCSEFIFDLCKEAAIGHYSQFESETGPVWMHLTKKPKLGVEKPFNKNSLEEFINNKVKELLGYEIVKSAENIKRKWCGKKRDHVDELLVVECQAEENDWTNYDRDELHVKDELTNDIWKMLLNDTVQVFGKILTKKTFIC